MWQPLLDRLADRFRLVAPDYPGFGHSDAPSHTEFAYTFDHLAAVVGDFTQALELATYTLVLQDYGGPVGFRLAIAHPERLDVLIVQNAVAHEDGLGPLWKTRRELWADRQAHGRRRPPLQVVWGRYDPSFQVQEAEAYRRDVPDAEVHIVDAGHFALDEEPDLIADLTRRFLQRRQAHTGGLWFGSPDTVIWPHAGRADHELLMNAVTSSMPGQ
jgi:pimeloyl-ACP methyl ester carboxylesterase